MSDINKHEKTDKGLISRTASYTSKRARRAQTKLKQRVGKGDETKDEVFDEFVHNFNKQQTAAARLHLELKNYIRCITAMQVAAANYGDAVKDVYEEEWACRDKVIGLFKESDSNWTYLGRRLTDEVLEPLTSYQKPFIEVKNKINKRARKLVDYDHSRHAVDTLRAKGATKSNDAKKLNQAEEEYQKAKDIFIDMTSELYEELPVLYDSRIGFYVSCFQSVFTLEEVFHREAANIEHQLNDLMDQLIRDFSAGTYSTRKPFSAGLETTPPNPRGKEENDTKLSSGSLAQFYDVAVPANEQDIDSTGTGNVNKYECNATLSDDSMDSISNNEIEPVTKLPVPDQPIRLAPTPPARPVSTPPRPKTPNTPAKAAPVSNATEKKESDNSKEETKPVTIVASYEATSSQVTIENQATNSTPSPVEPSTSTEDDSKPAEKTQLVNQQQAEADHTVETANTVETGLGGNIVAYKNTHSPDNTDKSNLVVPASLYKVVTTHKYSPEDEDELSFEKGEIIHIVPYEDPEEQDDGWLMGVMDSSGLVGVFPENFSKKLT